MAELPNWPSTQADLVAELLSASCLSGLVPSRTNWLSCQVLSSTELSNAKLDELPSIANLPSVELAELLSAELSSVELSGKKCQGLCST